MPQHAPNDRPCDRNQRDRTEANKHRRELRRAKRLAYWRANGRKHGLPFGSKRSIIRHRAIAATRGPQP